MNKNGSFMQLSGVKKQLILGLVFLIIACLVYWIKAAFIDLTDSRSASGFLTENKFIVTGFPIFILGILIWLGLGEDLKSGTIIKEVVSKNSRNTIFNWLLFKKLIIFFLCMGLISMLLVLVPELFLNLIIGWGDKAEFTETVTRILLMFFPYLRIVSFLTLITIVVKNLYITFFSGIVDVIVLGVVLEPRIGNAFTTGYANVAALMRYDHYGIYSIKPGVGFVDYAIPHSVFSGNLFLGTIGYSLLMTAIFLFMGYMYLINFSENDNN